MIKIDFEINDTSSAEFGRDIHLAKGNGESDSLEIDEVNNWAVETFLVAEEEAGFSAFGDLPVNDNSGYILGGYVDGEEITKNIVGKINGQIYSLEQTLSPCVFENEVSYDWHCSREVKLVEELK